MAGTLYIVATPIGNLEDVTLRAIRILSEVDIILAEDTRVTRKLLAFVNSNFHLSISNKNSQNSQPITHNPSHFTKASRDTHLISYHQHSDENKKFEILKNLIDGKNIALVTDAGTPGISDPGNELLGFLHEKEPNIPIVPIPGPSAVTTALSVSGMNINRFVFAGFLPKKGLNKFLDQYFSLGLPVVYFDSPHRAIQNLKLIEERMGISTEVFVARELTKVFETIYRGKINDVIENLGSDKIRGEVTIVVKSHHS